MDYFREHLDPLAKKYPNFKVIAFTVPCWHDSPQEDILAKGFIKFCVGRPWLIIAVHGLNHMTYEAIGDRASQRAMFGNGQRILAALKKQGVKTLNAFKPPFYRWNYDSLDLASETGYRFYFTQDGIHDLKTFRFYGRGNIMLFDSHTNPDQKVNMLDRIDLKPFDYALEHMHELEMMI